VYCIKFKSIKANCELNNSSILKFQDIFVLLYIIINIYKILVM